MDFRFTEEEEAFRKEVRDFIRESLPPDWLGVDPGPEEEAREDVYQLAVEIWHKLGARGWIGMSWPKEYGGQDASLMKDIILAEELACRGAPGNDIAQSHGEIILQFGTEEQKRRFIPPITRGEVKYSIGMSEPNAGSDTFALQLRAVEEADCFVVNGQKVWTSGAQNADWCMVYARTDPNAPKHLGISAFLIDLKSPGITMHRVTQMTGLDPFCEVFYDNVRVPKENLLGEKNGGWQILLYAFGGERSYGLFVLYNARRYLNQLVQYCKETHIDGQPLAKDSLIRNRLAQMAIEIEVGCNLGDKLNWMVSQGMPTVLVSSQIKVHGAAVAQRLANLGQQILGLYGPLDEKSKWAKLGGRMKHTYLNTIAASLAGGTSEVSRNHIAGRAGLGLPKR
jgi:alkylation response protein AidB-like acyl-CoA dehydrogenase